MCEGDPREVFAGEVPSMDDMDECAHRACLRMADVTVIHSVTTNATGSTATETAAVRLAGSTSESSILLDRLSLSLNIVVSTSIWVLACEENVVSFKKPSIDVRSVPPPFERRSR